MQRRNKEYIKPKYIAMAMIKEMNGDKYSLAKIGTYFNNRDHATVLRAIKCVKNEESIYPSYRQLLVKIRDCIIGEFACLREDYDTDKV